MIDKIETYYNSSSSNNGNSSYNDRREERRKTNIREKIEHMTVVCAKP